LSGGLVDVGQDHPARSFRCEAPAERAADATTPTGDNDHLALELHAGKIDGDRGRLLDAPDRVS
jgi:hypothetical protein